MKRFSRSLSAKVILYILCIIFICSCAVSSAGILYIIDHGYYNHSEQYIINNFKKEYFEDYGLNVLYSHYMPGSYEAASSSYDDIPYVIENGIGEIIKSSVEVDKESHSYREWNHELYYYLVLDGYNINDIWCIDKIYYSDWESYNTLYIDSSQYMLSKNTLTTAIDFIGFLYDIKYILYVILALSVILFIICFVALLKASGRRCDSDDIVPGPLHVIPYDLLLSVTGAFFLTLINFVFYARYRLGNTITTALLITIFLLCAITAIGLCMSLATRLKTKTLFNKLLIYRIYLFVVKIIINGTKLSGRILTAIPFVWRTALIIAVLSICEFFGIMICEYEIDNLLILWFIEKIVLIPVILFIAFTLKKLKDSGTALANGNITHHTDTSKMFFDFKKHGENLNSIAKGMSIAVEDRLKSERMKTELITNVSHDIKTPLTSIINYTNLISNEECDNENIIQYTEVLTRQSDRLKRLIEDLVEASKASTGNLEVTLAPCDASIFISQADGEYDEKLQRANLTLITKQPDTPIKIMADGRRMWRIFDNLMNNICKYAAPGTRVYLSLEQIGTNAIIIFKNISKDELDISEDELMERFVRGDSSRNTDGNGLGLSIAKSMAELQNGSLSITIDGDLFKATLSFPITE